MSIMSMSNVGYACECVTEREREREREGVCACGHVCRIKVYALRRVHVGSWHTCIDYFAALCTSYQSLPAVQSAGLLSMLLECQ